MAGLRAAREGMHRPDAAQQQQGVRDNIDADVTVPKMQIQVDVVKNESADKSELQMPRLVIANAVKSSQNSDAVHDWCPRSSWSYESAWQGSRVLWLKAQNVADDWWEA